MSLSFFLHFLMWLQRQCTVKEHQLFWNIHIISLFNTYASLEAGKEKQQIKSLFKTFHN